MKNLKTEEQYNEDYAAVQQSRSQQRQIENQIEAMKAMKGIKMPMLQKGQENAI
jgi:hypothetical protein